MPRLGKQTLYLDLDALEDLREALSRLPGRPSVSSYLSEQLPFMAKSIRTMTDALEGRGLRGFAELVNEVADQEETVKREVKQKLQTTKKADRPLSELVRGVPPKKPRKAAPKKVVKT